MITWAPCVLAAVLAASTPSPLGATPGFEEVSAISTSGAELRIQVTDEHFSYALDQPPMGVATRVVIAHCRLAPGVGQAIKDVTKAITSLAFEQINDNLAIDVAAASGSQISVRRSGRYLVLSAAGPVLSGPPSVGNSSTRLDHGQRRVVIRLKYAGVGEIADALVPNAQLSSNDSLPTIPGGVSGGTVAGLGTPVQTAITPTSDRESLPAEHVSSQISVDQRLNALILTGTDDEIRDFEDTISQLDVPAPSVMIDAEIVELDEQGARDLGIDFSAGGNAGTATMAVHNLAAPSSSASFQAALYAEIQNGRGKILARPRIATQSSVPAFIQTGDAIPVFTAVTYPGATAVTQQQVQYVNVGVTLAIRPRVGPNGVVVVNIEATVSSVTGYVQSAPEVSERTITAIANVRDAHSFVLGGLVQESDISQVAHLPVLGYLPILGKLFSVEHSTHQRTNLYITITPHVIDPSALGDGS